jgi:hypothetical protein
MQAIWPLIVSSRPIKVDHPSFKRIRQATPGWPESLARAPVSAVQVDALRADSLSLAGELTHVD